MLNRKVTPIIIVVIFFVGIIITTINYRMYRQNMEYSYSVAITTMESADLEVSDNNIQNISPGGQSNNNLENNKETIQEQNGDMIIVIAPDSSLFDISEYYTYLEQMEKDYEKQWDETDRTDLVKVKNIADAEYQSWDGELNYVYELIRGIVDADTFEQLKKEEIEWINEKENKALQEAQLYTGTSYNLAYTRTLIEETQARTYYLIKFLYNYLY